MKGSTFVIIVAVLFSILVYFFLICAALSIAENREDDTPKWEVILLCIFFSPLLAILIELLKPYKPWMYCNKNKEEDK